MCYCNVNASELHQDKRMCCIPPSLLHSSLLSSLPFSFSFPESRPYDVSNAALSTPALLLLWLLLAAALLCCSSLSKRPLLLPPQRTVLLVVSLMFYYRLHWWCLHAVSRVYVVLQALCKTPHAPICVECFRLLLPSLENLPKGPRLLCLPVHLQVLRVLPVVLVLRPGAAAAAAAGGPVVVPPVAPCILVPYCSGTNPSQRSHAHGFLSQMDMQGTAC